MPIFRKKFRRHCAMDCRCQSFGRQAYGRFYHSFFLTIGENPARFILILPNANSTLEYGLSWAWHRSVNVCDEIIDWAQLKQWLEEVLVEARIPYRDYIPAARGWFKFNLHRKGGKAERMPTSLTYLPRSFRPFAARIGKKARNPQVTA